MTISHLIIAAVIATTLIFVASAVPGIATYYTVYVPSASSGNQDEGTMIAAASEALWNNGAIRGARFSVKCTGPAGSCRGGSVTVTVMDQCPGCPWGGLDISLEAFSAIADPAAGRINIDYTQV